MKQHTQSVPQKSEKRWDLSDQPKRSLAKTVSWRCTGSFSTFVISYMVSGNFIIAGSIAIIQVTANTVLYYIHERLWDRVSWGRKH
jgi:uncharacterized membrane protein